jgi:hypothetical protein
MPHYGCNLLRRSIQAYPRNKGTFILPFWFLFGNTAGQKPAGDWSLRPGGRLKGLCDDGFDRIFRLDRAALIKRRSPGEQAALGTVLVAAPVLLRLLIDPVPATMPFMAFWPTVLIATLLLDLRQALATVAVSFCVSKLVFGGQVVSVDWWAGRAITFVLAVFSLGLLICTAVVTRSTVRELDALASRQDPSTANCAIARATCSPSSRRSARGPRAENPLDFFREFSAVSKAWPRPATSCASAPRPKAACPT